MDGTFPNSTEHFMRRVVPWCWLQTAMGGNGGSKAVEATFSSRGDSTKKNKRRKRKEAKKERRKSHRSYASGHVVIHPQCAKWDRGAGAPGQWLILLGPLELPGHSLLLSGKEILGRNPSKIWMFQENGHQGKQPHMKMKSGAKQKKERKIEGKLREEAK